MSIIMNLRELEARQVPRKFEHTIELNHLIKDSADILNAEPLEVHLEAISKHGVAEVTGRCKTRVEMVCARTLVNFHETFDYEFEQAFSLYQTAAANDEDIEWVQTDTVDLVPYLEEAFVLQLPFIPICKDAQGAEDLIEKYGRDKSAEGTAIQKPKIDPRLAGLKDFFKNKE